MIDTSTFTGSLPEKSNTGLPGPVSASKYACPVIVTPFPLTLFATIIPVTSKVAPLLKFKVVGFVIESPGSVNAPTYPVASITPPEAGRAVSHAVIPVAGVVGFWA